LLLLATTTGYQIRAFDEAAVRLGVDLIVASDHCDELDDPWSDGAIAVRFNDMQQAVADTLTGMDGQVPDGLLTVGDRPVLLAAQLADAWDLPGHPPAAAEASGHKLATRRAFDAAGLPVPWFAEFTLDTNLLAISAGLPFPVVVKPLSLSGSRGVMRADDPDGFVAVVDRLQRLLEMPDVRKDHGATRGTVLVETFVPGSEFAVEGLLECGSFRAFAIFDKPVPLDGPFFEETIYVTPSRAPHAIQAVIIETVERAAWALGLYHGPIHAECRVNHQGVYVLEVAARPIGGLCARTLHFATPVGPLASYEEVLIRHALGEDVSGYVRETVASGVMMIPVPARGVYRSVSGLHRARRVPHVTDVRITAKLDSLLVPLPEGRSYLGFVFASSEDPADVKTAMEEAHACLEFKLDPEIPVI
jgi:biotin carboxylase